MNHNAPIPPRPLRHLAEAQRRPILTTTQLRAHGVSAATAAERCRAGGPWHRLLPGVHLLHPGPATGEERLRAALLYAASRGPAAERTPDHSPDSHAPGHGSPDGRTPGHESPDGRSSDGRVPGDRDRAPLRFGEAMVTGMAALALYGFSGAPPLPAVDRVDVLVPRSRQLRAAGFVHIVHAPVLPSPEIVAGLPTAPVLRALADAVASLTDPAAVRHLLAEAVRDGWCEAADVIRELDEARLLSGPHVAGAVQALLTAGRAVTEGRLYTLVSRHALPEPLWNVELRLPSGTHLGAVDAYWPDQAVAVKIVAWERGTPPDGTARPDRQPRPDRSEWPERLGISVLRVTPGQLREAPGRQAALVRTALMAAADLGPAADVFVLPR
jgi:hypothetical protein